MRYEVILAPGTTQAYKRLPAHVRSRVRDALERHLRHEPTKVSKSRIKRLQGLSRPQYRLRIEDIRCYDVTETTVEVLAIVAKAQAQAWLEQQAKPEASRSGDG